MQAPYVLVRSALRGVAWPAITGPVEATALALQYQLERSQWLPAQELRALQSRQLAALVRHAWRTVPFYRWQWHGSPCSRETPALEGFEHLPLVRRENLELDFEELRSNAPPAAHGAVAESRAAAASGRPVRFLRSALVDLWQEVLTLREHLWHRRDFEGTLAVVQGGLEASAAPGWGPGTGMMAAAGRCVTLGLPAGVEAQLDWLRRHEPTCLLTSPANAVELARSAIARGVRLAGLREVRASDGPVGAAARALIRKAFGVPLTDVYTTGETGAVALQCPGREHYHVQSESVLVEVLDRAGKACAPGTVGRIVVTTLHNFAMPLVRYETGDLAEVGDPCPCGRGLPVLRRVLGQASDPPEIQKNAGQGSASFT